jgi:hypothetical protein
MFKIADEYDRCGDRAADRLVNLAKYATPLRNRNNRKPRRGRTGAFLF